MAKASEGGVKKNVAITVEGTTKIFGNVASINPDQN
jgi:hypothetical protein